MEQLATVARTTLACNTMLQYPSQFYNTIPNRTIKANYNYKN